MSPLSPFRPFKLTFTITFTNTITTIFTTTMTTTLKPNTDAVIGVIFLGRKRPGFDPEWGAAMENRVRAFLAAENLATVTPAEKVTDEPTLRAALKLFAERGVNALAILQTTQGDGRLSQTVAQTWPDPVILWATPEKPTGDMISSCSLVATHNWATHFRMLGRRAEIVYGAPEDAAVKRQFTEAVNIVLTARRLRSTRLALVGSHAPGFLAMANDTFHTLRDIGAQTQTYSLVEFTDIARAIPDDAIADDVARFKQLGIPHKDTTDDDLPTASRLYLAMRHFFDNEKIDALALREWPEMPNIFGQWPYVGMTRLLDEGRVVACEGDADGALAMFIGQQLGFGPSYITDWLEHDDKTITAWHIGAMPTKLSPPPGQPGGPRLAIHYNIKKPLCVESTLTPGMPVTMARFWRCDGKWLATAREGVTLKPRHHFMMSNGLVELTRENPRAWFDTIVNEGMPHHPIVFRGHHEEMLKRFARVMKMQFI